MGTQSLVVSFNWGYQKYISSRYAGKNASNSLLIYHQKVLKELMWLVLKIEVSTFIVQWLLWKWKMEIIPRPLSLSVIFGLLFAHDERLG
ncbi:hypothetical protein [Coxiella endosymbiont of Amblyomma nuttalli]|uniref:hypothetical protein n=1 Tax=Coxiella endosymbiont of Amblyomma nuttalli TaxID=2749996 RepID=UPI001BADAFF0|nr:hypothetical protein [Coxiella endosymbiont of Amblyomma nuttalli]QTS83573.1 hypothetical protein CEAn_00023 [Coxiella endosymbiont of Amblyomma nuttalli]